MRLTIRTILLAVVLVTAGFNGFSQSEVINNVKIALKSSSAKELARYFSQNIEINLDGEINTYSKAQAEFVLKDFFKKYPSSDFQFIHQGASKGGLKYAIGKYSHKNGSFRVWMRIKQFNEKYLVYEMNFIKE